MWWSGINWGGRHTRRYNAVSQVVWVVVGILVACTPTVPATIPTPPQTVVPLRDCRHVDSADCHITVTSDADAGPGTLRAAILGIAPYGTITFALTTPYPRIMLDAPLHIQTPLFIDGEAGVIVDGNGRTQVIDVAANAEVYLRKITIRAGRAKSGAGIHNAGTLVLDSSAVVANSGLIGAAIMNTGRMVIVNTTIGANISGMATVRMPLAGSIIANAAHAELRLLHTTVAFNYADKATLHNMGQLTLHNTLIAHTTQIHKATMVRDCLSDTAVVQAGTMIEDGSCAAVLRGDPQLVDHMDELAGVNWYALTYGKNVPPAKSGDADMCSDELVQHVDQREVPRTLPCDIGAYEAHRGDVPTVTRYRTIITTMTASALPVTETASPQSSPTAIASATQTHTTPVSDTQTPVQATVTLGDGEPVRNATATLAATQTHTDIPTQTHTAVPTFTPVPTHTHTPVEEPPPPTATQATTPTMD